MKPDYKRFFEYTLTTVLFAIGVYLAAESGGDWKAVVAIPVLIATGVVAAKIKYGKV